MSGLLVLGLEGDHVPHAALRVGRVAFVARNDVDVGVPHRLAGGLAAVGADVEAVGVEFLLQEGPHGAGELEAVRVFLVAQVVHRGGVAPGDDEDVARRHRVLVVHGDAGSVLGKDLAAGAAEDAGFGGHG